MLEVGIRRRRKMWSWEHIKNHRQACAHYKDLYKKLLLSSKPAVELLTQIEVVDVLFQCYIRQCAFHVLSVGKCVDVVFMDDQDITVSRKQFLECLFNDLLEYRYDVWCSGICAGSSANQEDILFAFLDE